MISIQQLNYHYKDADAPSLRDINLDIKSQSLFGLLGPNGAGKTTLLSILSGLQLCQPNNVYIDGEDVCLSSQHWKSTSSLIPQEYAFYNRLSVKENLRFFSGAQGIKKSQMDERISEAVEISGLQDRLNQQAQSLSGGLKRRLNLAIGLLNRPKLLLLDEPTVGIDPHSRFFILEAIKKLNQQGTTILYTSHYMEEVEALCDTIAIIDGGKVLVQGSLSDLLARGHDDRLSLTLAAPLTTSQLVELRIGLDQMSTQAFGQESSQTFAIEARDCQLELRLPRSVKAVDVLYLLQQSHVDILRIHYGASNLEELFLNLTQRSLRD